MNDYLSTFRVPIDRIPEAKKWKVGGKYQLLAEVEQTGVNKERHYGEESLEYRKGKRPDPKFRTMVEFKVYNVSAKDKALKAKTK